MTQQPRLIHQAELIDAPAVPLRKRPAAHQGAPAPRENSLTAMVAENRATAAAVVINEAWWPAQRAWLAAETDRLGAMLETAMASMKQRTDARWGKVWRLTARYEYMEETLQCVKEHPIVCLGCGFGFGADIPAEDVTGVSLRGLIDGGTWLRYCIQPPGGCNDTWVQSRTAELIREWK